MSQVKNYTEAKWIFEKAKQRNYALPAINVVTSCAINATLEAARTAKSPVIIQFSHSGAHFYAGESLDNITHQVSIRGAVAAAKYVHEVSDLYGVPVLLNTDHARRELLPWVDGMLEHGKKFREQYGRPLFTSHMIDLSDESLHTNIETCKRYLEKLTELDMYLEMELGITGGIEDGVDNTGVDSSKLYTQPEEVAYAYAELSKISENFMIAASFGNVHGVYKPGNVKLEPKILRNSQEYLKRNFNTRDNVVSFVFHGGSGSKPDEIHEAIRYGVVKMNIDTDIQWSFWDGVHCYYQKNQAYLQSQLGNPNGDDEPNKKFYNSRAWLRDGEIAMRDRLVMAFADLNAVNVLDPPKANKKNFIL